jgi:hypothetical protein
MLRVRSSADVTQQARTSEPWLHHSIRRSAVRTLLVGAARLPRFVSSAENCGPFVDTPGFTGVALVSSIQSDLETWLV